MSRPCKVDAELRKCLEEELEEKGVRRVAKDHNLSISTVKRHVKR
jgi:transposase